MSKWSIEYFDSNDKNSIENWIKSLSDSERDSVVKELFLLEQLGNRLKMPHSKSLGKGLFELRERRFGYRVYYCFFKDKVIILLNSGSKKRQEKDINLARRRLSSLNN